LHYIYTLNDQKNKDILSEKTHSVLVELQHKLSNIQNFDDDMSVILDDLLIKFSSVFFSDINLFDLSGNLISTSRPQIYDEHLISRKMNTTAYGKLVLADNSFFIHSENIGKQDFLSAYIPFINNQNETIAFINLPYFAKESDIKSEVSTFLLAYINIYVILIAISIIIALIISNYISRPINMIMDKLKRIKFGGQNEKIIWQRDDEIGNLIFEYNRMIDELSYSAELLARSEREYAWREMAKQVAHEIKNPLTPMKLNVQHLHKSWFDGAQDWNKKLDKFTKSMIEQIDTLSSIASEFSDFAKMPVSKKEYINVIDVVETSTSLFKNYHNISINIHVSEKIKSTVFADYDQLLRAFNNLIKNSVQAIGNNLHGNIDINISNKYDSCIIQIKDNGKGIPREFESKIFAPNFTTKSGGMGLGLSIVKNIISSSNGKIEYASALGKGTTFVITIPLVS
nr:GHKL domain-containing protein [Bacteroidota bacterium]